MGAAVDSDTELQIERAEGEAVEFALMQYYSFSPGSKTLIAH